MARRPGLQRIKGSNIEEVEKARLHLIELLEDPHYRAAAIQINRSGKLKELLADTGGKPSVDTLVQRNLAGKPKATTGRRGAPTKVELNGLKVLLEVLERSPIQGRSLTEWCRMIAREQWPSATDEQIKKVSKAAQRKLSDIKRRKSERK